MKTFLNFLAVVIAMCFVADAFVESQDTRINKSSKINEFGTNYLLNETEIDVKEAGKLK